MQPRADRGERREDHDVAVPEDERPLAVETEDVGPWNREVRPPGCKREANARERDDCRVDGPPRGAVHDGVDRRDRANDPLAESDDDEQAVPFRDVAGMPRRPALPALRDERTCHLESNERGGDRERRFDRQVDDRERDPEHLRDGDRPHVGRRRRTPRRIVARGSPPTGTPSARASRRTPPP